MLASVFSKVLNMSLAASLVILTVYLARLLLTKAPKIYSYILWGVVLFRLLCPVSLFSSLSLIPSRISTGQIVAGWEDNYVGEVRIYHDNRPEYTSAIEAGRPPIPADEDHSYVVTGEDGVSAPDTVENTILPVIALVWLLGMAGMGLSSAVSYWKLRKKVRISMPLQRRVFIADDIETPFVMGFFRPVIYLPGSLEAKEQTYILAHEQHHIRRGDHIFKALGFLALSIHWFNPLVWLAFLLASRDMEMSCDEAVIRKLGETVRADYAASLLKLATGQRLLGTPLAFGEGDPTGRVRNLARWKKPALWIVIVCILLCAVLAVCLLTDPKVPEQETPQIEETVPMQPAQTGPPEATPAEADTWGVSLVLDKISRTEIAVSFVYPRAFPGKVIYYDESFSLERMKNGVWETVDGFPGYEFTDATYAVTDADAWCYVWQDHFGALPDGKYRLVKRIFQNSQEERTLYCEFSLPEDIPSAPVLLEELPEIYGEEQALLDGCFVQENGVADDFSVEVDGIPRSNKETFRKFAEDSLNEIPSFIRIINWYHGEQHYYTASDLSYDGTSYTITWLENGKRYEKQYRHLKHYKGLKEQANVAYDSYEHYVLVNDDSTTWSDIWEGLISSQSGAGVDHTTVYSDYTYEPQTVALPEGLTEASLEFEGEVLVTATDAAQLEGIYGLFDGADILGYEPKTHSTDLQLHLVLTFRGGETVIIDLDPDHDICRIDGEFVFYGAFDEPVYIEKLWNYLAIPAWPDVIYEKYPYAYPS